MKFLVLFLVFSVLPPLVPAQFESVRPSAVRADTVLIRPGLGRYVFVTTSSRIAGGDSIFTRFEVGPLDRSSPPAEFHLVTRNLPSDTVIDVNFDGCRDFVVYLDSEEPVNTGQSSNVYLFDSSSGSFRQNARLSGLSELTVNPIDSTLRSQIFMLGAGEDYQTYKVLGDSLVLIAHEHREGDEYRREVLRNGDIVTIDLYERRPAPPEYDQQWFELIHSKETEGALRPVRVWIARRVGPDENTDAIPGGVVRELRWGEYLVSRETSYRYAKLPSGLVSTIAETRAVIDGKWTLLPPSSKK